MATVIDIRRSYKYRLYRHDDNRYLVNGIDIVGIIWNHSRALQKRCYRLFVKSREINRQIKTVTVKRDNLGRLWVVFSVIEKVTIRKESSTGQSGGFDFGLKHFLTNDAGRVIESPQFFKHDAKRIRKQNQKLSGMGSMSRRILCSAFSTISFGLCGGWEYLPALAPSPTLSL